MECKIRVDGSVVTIRTAIIAAYGRPPEWEAEFDNWPSIPAVRFREWPDSNFEVIKRTAARLLRQAERDAV